MLRASDVRAAVRADAIAILPGVRALSAQGVVPGGSRANLAFVADRTQFPSQMSEADRLVFADAQTHGGLLAAGAPEGAPRPLHAPPRAGGAARGAGRPRAGGARPRGDPHG